MINSDSQQDLKTQQMLQQRSVNNFMPTQAPQNSALYFQQATHAGNPQPNAVKLTMQKISPKNASQQPSTEMQPRETKYSPIRKDPNVKPVG